MNRATKAADVVGEIGGKEETREGRKRRRGFNVEKTGDSRVEIVRGQLGNCGWITGICME